MHMHMHMRMHAAGPPTSGGACTACILHAPSVRLLRMTLLAMAGPRPHRLRHVRAHRLCTSLQARLLLHGGRVR